MMNGLNWKWFDRMAIHAVASAFMLMPVACGTRAPSSLPRPHASKRLHVIELPTLDLGVPVPSAKDDRSPVSLEQAIPFTVFAVRFGAHRARDKGPLPTRGVLFCLNRRDSKGKLVRSVTCHMIPTGMEVAGSIIYEGTCPAPNRKGEYILEVIYRDRSYFVRKVRVQ